MEAGLFNTFAQVKLASRKRRISDEDFIDRLNNFLTPTLLCLLSVIICAKQYVVGEPLQCWVPKEFSGDWEKYAENYCWVQNTYFVPPHQELPEGVNVRAEKEIGYYQWVPFLLAIQAGLFLIPAMIWKTMNRQTGMDIRAFVNMAIEANTVDPVSRDTNIRMIARHMKACLLSDWDSEDDNDDKHVRLGIFKFLHGIILSTLYVTVKLLYVANIICQFLILQSFLGTGNDGTFFGFKLFNDILNGKDWQVTGAFPRVTMCDFEVNAIGQKRKYSLQCVLVINLFNEKIYIFIWFWLTFIGIITVLSLLMWMGWFIFPNWKQKTIFKYIDRNEKLTQRLLRETKNKALLASENILQERKKLLVDDVLRSDGLFMLRMVANNAGEPIVNDIVTALWLDYAGIRSLHDEDANPKPPEDTADHGNPSGEDEESDIDNNVPQTSST